MMDLKMSVLVVDDFASIRRTVRGLSRRQGLHASSRLMMVVLRFAGLSPKDI